ncbi:MAG TPA: single-stranded DNA-binding protein [Flavobacteriales bacterium]|nr:single-stranded DNA-binding protein [Flavobacteriales bacterium]
MAGSVNKVILVGNLGKDPEVRTLENGVKKVSFPLATSEVYKDKDTGDKRTETEWHNIVIWRGLADVAEKYLRKGQQVYVEGKIKSRQYKDKEGNQRYITEVVADNFVMMSRSSDAPKNNEGSNTGNDNYSSSPTDDLPF